ncbi:MAG: DNA polymerase IV [Dehalococcoidia bacterium]|nr:DNA polymerase IV [Dehalococcoidia bacterium]
MRSIVERAQRVIIHVDLDAFYVGVELARRPELRGLPVIVGGPPGSRGVVLSASYEARPFGVDAGMPSSRASRLCPRAAFVTADFAAYRAASTSFMAVLRDFSPLVEPLSLDEAYLDYSGCEALTGPPLTAAELIRKRVFDAIAVTSSVGIGGSRLVAKVASGAAKPDGVLFVEQGQEASFLAPLPIRKLPGIGPRAQASLERLGIRTLGQVVEAGEDLLKQHFGARGAELHQRALGIDAGAINAGRPASRSISKASTFATDLRDEVRLRAALLEHCEGVAAEARRAGKRARTITLQLRFDDFQSVTRSTTVMPPTASADVVFTTAAALLAAELKADARPVRLLGVALSNLGDGAQLDLFGEQKEREALDAALDDLRARFGSGVIRRGASSRT